MPEGPEVQTIANGLRALVVGLIFKGVTFFGDAAKMVESMTPDQLQDAIAGQTVVDVGRRGKFIDIALDSGMHLFIHLMMTGRLVFQDDAHHNEPPRFLRCAFAFENGAELYIGDQRKWAMIVCLPADRIETDKRFARLGVDALTDAFTFERFRALLTSRRNLHTFLLDQNKLSGLGNIYVNEALFQAGLHPLRPANALSEAETMALYHAIRCVVREAVRQLGTSFSDYWMPDGTPGEFQNFLHVFQRRGEPCLRCGTPIERIGMGGRGAFFCPHDQPLETRREVEKGLPESPELSGTSPLPNYLFILAGRDPVERDTLATQIAATVPFVRMMTTTEDAQIDRVLRAGNDALIPLPAGDMTVLKARYPNAYIIGMGEAGGARDCAISAASPEAAIHAAFAIIYAVRCQNPTIRAHG